MLNLYCKQSNTSLWIVRRNKDLLYYTIYWLTDKLTHSLTDSLTHRLTESLTNWLTDSPTHWITDWLTHWITDWLTDWRTDSAIDRPTCWGTLKKNLYQTVWFEIRHQCHTSEQNLNPVFNANTFQYYLHWEAKLTFMIGPYSLVIMARLRKWIEHFCCVLITSLKKTCTWN